MALQSLLLCHDKEVLRVVRSILHDLGIGQEVCFQPAQVVQHLQRRKFEVVVVEADAPGALQVLRELRCSKSNRQAIAFLIARDAAQVPAAFHMDADFVLPRPLALEEAWRAFRTARQLMEREQRRYFRGPAEVPVELRLGDERVLTGAACNLGSGGLALQTSERLHPGTALRLSFPVPGGQALIEALAQVAWSDAQGRAGLHFVSMSRECQKELQRWVAEKLEQREFAFVSVTPRGERRFLDAGLQERALLGS